MENKFEFIICDQLDIFASLEIHQSVEHSSYHPFPILWKVQKGTLHLKTTTKSYAFGAGRYVLVNKFTYGTYLKTWTTKEGYAELSAIALHNSLIKDIILDIKSSFQPKSLKSLPPIHELNSSEPLERLFAFSQPLLSDKKEIDKRVLEPLIKASLTAILKEKPEFLEIFELSYYPTKVELRKFMNENYTQPVTLKELARLSGRSLSTFHRDFKRIFQKPPHKWILTKRLERAKELLQASGQTISQTYLEVGFKDLAHFSKAFKKQFGIPPSEFQKKVIKNQYDTN